MTVHITNETRKRLQRESDNRRNPDVIRTAEGLTRKRVRWPAEWGPSTVNQYCFTPAPMDTAESVQADQTKPSVPPDDLCWCGQHRVPGCSHRRWVDTRPESVQADASWEQDKAEAEGRLVQADAEPCDHEGIGAGLIGCAAELLVAHRMAQLRQERGEGRRWNP